MIAKYNQGYLILMNIEHARFNMIEQQVKPWKVFDENLLLFRQITMADAVPAMLSGSQDVIIGQFENPRIPCRDPDRPSPASQRLASMAP